VTCCAESNEQPIADFGRFPQDSILTSPRTLRRPAYAKYLLFSRGDSAHFTTRSTDFRAANLTGFPPSSAHNGQELGHVNNLQLLGRRTIGRKGHTAVPVSPILVASLRFSRSSPR